MPYDSNVMRRATQALEARKAARLEQQEVLRQKIYRQLPRVAEIDRRIGELNGALAALLEREGEARSLDIRAQREDIFNAMHRI